MSNYIYDSTMDQFVSDDADFKPIRRDSAIRHKITALKFEKNEFIGISSIKEDYLGVVQAWTESTTIKIILSSFIYQYI